MQPRTKLTVVLAVLAVGAAAMAPILVPAAKPMPEISVTEISVAEAPVVAEPEVHEVVVAAPAVVEADVEAVPTTPAEVDKEPSVTKAIQRARNVDVVIVLDTSGSMNALIDSARARLWDIVNDVVQREPNANLRVGLVAFGSPAYGADSGYVKVVSDLSSDLDAVYGKAMSLSIAGGDEYVGWALHTALGELSWSGDDGAARLLFVAGNESADQASHTHDFRRVAREAKNRGILVNAMFAGSKQTGIELRWGEVAESGGGVYTHIDMQRGTVQVAAPQDAALQKLNAELNGTYRGYGALGASGSAAQQRADSASSGMGSGTMSSRIGTKGSATYGNADWDIVDGVNKGKIDLATAAEAELPKELRGKSAEERQAIVDALAAERARIQGEIRRLAEDREQFIKKSRSKSSEKGLDEATEAMIEQQL